MTKNAGIYLVLLPQTVAQRVQQAELTVLLVDVTDFDRSTTGIAGSNLIAAWIRGRFVLSYVALQ